MLIFNTTENSAADLRMSSPCGTCNEDCGPDHVKCYVCNKIYHFSRGGVMETIYRKWDTARKQGWKCSQACRTQSSTPTDETLSLDAVGHKLNELCLNIANLTCCATAKSNLFASAVRDSKTG